MTSAVDTNILVALFSGTEVEAETARQVLTEAAGRGAIVICGAVYAELLASPGLSEAELDTFLEETEVVVDWSLAQDIWRVAGRAYLGYAERRRKQKGDPGPRRILADFLIGAHALTNTNRLLTLDAQLYRANFGGLELVVPEAK